MHIPYNGTIGTNNASNTLQINTSNYVPAANGKHLTAPLGNANNSLNFIAPAPAKTSIKIKSGVNFTVNSLEKEITIEGETDSCIIFNGGYHPEVNVSHLGLNQTTILGNLHDHHDDTLTIFFGRDGFGVDIS